MELSGNFTLESHHPEESLQKHLQDFCMFFLIVSWQHTLQASKTC